MNEAHEIITNATACYRAGIISFSDWLDIVRRALKDAYLTLFGY
jgi:hypothetical protein